MPANVKTFPSASAHDKLRCSACSWLLNTGHLSSLFLFVNPKNQGKKSFSKSLKLQNLKRYEMQTIKCKYLIALNLQ